MHSCVTAAASASPPSVIIPHRQAEHNLWTLAITASLLTLSSSSWGTVFMLEIRTLLANERTCFRTCESKDINSKLSADMNIKVQVFVCMC